MQKNFVAFLLLSFSLSAGNNAIAGRWETGCINAPSGENYKLVANIKKISDTKLGTLFDYKESAMLYEYGDIQCLAKKPSKIVKDGEQFLLSHIKKNDDSLSISPNMEYMLHF